MSHVMCICYSKTQPSNANNLGGYLPLVREKSVNSIPILYCIHAMFSIRITLFCVAAAEKEWFSSHHFNGRYVLLRVQ